jgi:hypothetical protein
MSRCQGNLTCNNMLMSRYQKAGQSHSIKKANNSFKVVAKLKYLGTTLTDQNCIHKVIKNSLNLGKACYHSVQCRLSSCLLSRNVKVEMCKTIIMVVFCMGVKLGLSHSKKNIH